MFPILETIISYHVANQKLTLDMLKAGLTMYYTATCNSVSNPTKNYYWTTIFLSGNRSFMLNAKLTVLIMRFSVHSTHNLRLMAFSFLPPLLNLEEYETHSNEFLQKSSKEYYNLGACEMETLAENRRIFTRLLLLPKVLVNVSNIKLATKILGIDVSCPIGVAPAAMQSMAHDSGEISVAKACSRLKIVMGLSSQATKSIEDVASASSSRKLIFQLYVYKDRTVTLSLLKRAEKCGFKAVAVTVDRPALGKRESELRNKFSPPSHLSLANFSSVGVGTTDKSNLQVVRAQVEDRIDWSFLSWLREHTTMKIAVKGVLTAEAAVLAAQHGADAVWISNHGGRQLDCVPTAIEVLPEIRQAINDAGKPEVQLLVDGGFRRGTDILKALALGADMVFVGRPVIWGLSYAGEEGVCQVLSLLIDELSLAMKLCGVCSVQEISSDIVRHESYYRNRSKL